jgi:spoIIIJ-associated protein
MTDRRFFSGNTLDQAVMKAARHYNLTPDELDYRPVEKKHGFLRVRRSVVIEVDPAAPKQVLSDEEALRKAQSMPPEAQEATPRESGQPAPERKPRKSRAKGAERPKAAEKPAKQMVDLPERPVSAADKYPRAEGEVADAANESLEMLLDLAGVQMESSIHQGDERLEVELWGADQDRLLKDHGRPLLAIQHLMPRMIRGILGESVFCRVDCDQFHDLREERLRNLAQRVAGEVANEGRSRMLESMAPDERRIVHMTLTDDPHVVTESQGNGFFKRIKVRPA